MQKIADIENEVCMDSDFVAVKSMAITLSANFNGLKI